MPKLRHKKKRLCRWHRHKQKTLRQERKIKNLNFFCVLFCLSNFHFHVPMRRFNFDTSNNAFETEESIKQLVKKNKRKKRKRMPPKTQAKTAVAVVPNPQPVADNQLDAAAPAVAV